MNPTRLDNALDALRRRHPGLPFEPGYPLPDSPAAAFPAGELLRRAQEAAAGRTVLLFLGLPAADESEGYDRQHISLPAGHVDLLRAVRRVANGVIVLLSNGAAVETASWQDDADAIMELWLPGQGGGEAVARLVTGEDSPSGRLAETIPERLEQHPAQLNFPGEAGEVRYGEGIFVGYRGLQKLGNRPSYPFGHGLAYTTFEFSDLRTEVAEVTPRNGVGRGGSHRFVHRHQHRRPKRCRSPPSSISGIRSPRWAALPRELRGFRHLELGPGESAHAEIRVTRRDLSFWDVRTHSWSVEPGRIRVEIGASAEDIKLGLEADLPAPHGSCR